MLTVIDNLGASTFFVECHRSWQITIEKQIPRFIAPRCGAICYVIYFLSLLTTYGGIPQKSSKNHNLLTNDMY